MPKWDLNSRLPARGRPPNAPEDYALVAERIELFYQRFPRGRIITELVSRTQIPASQAGPGARVLSHAGREVTFRALLFRSPDEREPAATGWASERETDGEVNAVACLENSETSAIGRALANLGFTASRHRPSREEMDKADRERTRLARSRAVREVATEVIRSKPRLDADPLQREANALQDLLELLKRAERDGFPPRRAPPR